MDQTPSALPSMLSIPRRFFPLLLGFVVAPVAICVMALPGGRQLTPDYTGDDRWALAIALAVAALCFGVLIGVKPRTWKTIVAATLWPLSFAILCFPVAMTAIERAHEYADFSNVPIVSSKRYLPIESATMHRGRSGMIYDVWLTDYPVIMTIAPQDYRTAFGVADRVRAKGYCLRVMIETAGKAARIMADSARKLPPGTLVRCPGRS